MVRECSFRAAVCATFEANLAQYERDAAQYANAVQSYRNAAAAYDAAVRNAEPGEAVTVSPPGAGPGTPPTRPIPPQYWSA